MDAQELANSLFGASRLETTTLNTMSTIQGIAVADSADGKVKVKINGESIPEEADATESNTVVELPTTPAVKEGDTVTVTCEGGTLKVMSVTGNTGSGDRAKQATDDASKVATNYIDIDENKGITVGNMTDETLGKNTYIDANGFYVRDGETELAKFSDTSIKLAQNTTEKGTSSIYLCNEQAKIEKVEGEGLLISNLSETSKNGTAITLKGGYERKNEDEVLERAYSTAKIDKIITIDTVGGVKINSVDAEVSSTIVGGTTYTSNVNFLTEGANLTYTSKKNGTATGDEKKCIIAINTDGIQINDKAVLTSVIFDYFPFYYETVLYDDKNGSTGSINLSESAANFTYLEIYYNYYSSNFAESPAGFVKVYSPNGKYVTLESIRRSSTSVLAMTTTVKINETQITRETSDIYYLNGDTSTKSASSDSTTENAFYITRVVGINKAGE